jgi:YVTN family beta-propeller protein
MRSGAYRRRLGPVVVSLVVVAAFALGVMVPALSSTISARPAGSLGGVSAQERTGQYPASSTETTPPVPRSQSSIPAGGPLVYGVVATVSLPSGYGPVGVAADNANGDVYVTIPNESSVVVISGTTQKILTTIPLNESPAGLVFDSVYSEVFVGTFFGHTVKVISTLTNSIVANVSVPGSPVALVCDSLNGNVYVAQQSSNSVSVISGSTNTVTAVVPVGSYPMAGAFDNATGDVYVANYGSGNVSVISSESGNAVVASVPVGKNPIGATYDSGTGNVYVVNEYSNNTTVISGTSQSVVGDVGTSTYPVGVAYNPTHSIVAVVTLGFGVVRIISDATNAVIANVTVGSLPVGIAYDPSNGYEYVANSNSSSVSVIGTALAPPYPVAFTETGLPSGTSWSVTLNGVVGDSTTNTVAFSETNGSYSYSVGSIPGYSVIPSSGEFAVDGFPVNVDVTFSQPEYLVTFLETGLPNGTAWSVTFNGELGTSTISTLNFTTPNGTFDFNVSAVSGYTVSPSAGQVNVSGAASSLTLAFSSKPTPSSTSGSQSALWIYVVIAVVIAAVVLGAVLLMRRRRPPAASGAPPSTSPTSPPTPPPGSGSRP